MANIEVEVRGKVEGDFNKIVDFFRKKAKFIEEKDRFTLTYFKHGFVKDVRDIINEPVDLRLRVTNKKAEIIMKYGKFGGTDRRKEFSIPIALDKFDEAVEMFHLMGWNTGVRTTTKTFVFEYEGIEFAFVEHDNWNYFEAELSVSKASEVDEAEAKIRGVCQELELKAYTDDEFLDEINRVNNSLNHQFDFNKQSFNELKERFREFF